MGGSINTVAKGNRRQNSCRKILEKQGWLVYVAPRMKYGPVDIWNLWDVIAYRDGYILLIQVKSNYCPREVKTRLRAFTTDGLFVRRQLWIFKDYARSPCIEEMIGGE